MSFCSNCGRQLDESMKFCPGCGAPLNSSAVPAAQTLPANVPVAATAVQTPVAYTPATPAAKSDYRVILLGLGSCSRANARNLLSDLLGYTMADARELVNAVPAEIACCLNEQQACILAQALTEYGMEVTVCDSDDYVDLNSAASVSVFSENGSLLGGALAILATIGLVNRVSKIRKWNRPFGNYLFRPIYRRSVPPPPIRYGIHRRQTMIAPPRRRAPMPPRPPIGNRGPGPIGGPFGGPGRPGGPGGPRGGGRGPGGNPRGGRPGGGRGPGRP